MPFSHAPSHYAFDPQTVKETDFRSKKKNTTISSESAIDENDGRNDLKTGADQNEGGDGSETGEDQEQRDVVTTVNLHVHSETTGRLGSSSGGPHAVEDDTPRTETADDGSVHSKNSLDSEAGIIEAEPGKEFLALREEDSAQSSASNQSPESRDIEQGKPPPINTNVVANGCVICLEPYQSGEIVVWSNNQKCVHAFHQECLIEYFQAANKDNWVLRTDDENNTDNTTSEFPDTFCPCCRQDFFPRSSTAMILPGTTDSAATTPTAAISPSTTADTNSLGDHPTATSSE